MRCPALLFATLMSASLFASGPNTPPSGLHPVPLSAGASPSGFEENKGQVRTMEGEAAPHVRYRLSQGNTQIFLLGNGIAYQFRRTHLPDGYVHALKDGLPDDLEAPRVETGRMDVVLEGAALFPRITAEGRSTDHTNYYADDVFDVHSYTKVTHHDVYPGIDWVVYTTEEGIKQDFVVRPGADPSLIRMRHSHHEELYVDADGSLVHGNSMGRFTEHAPVSFQDGKEIATRFVVDGDEVRFALAQYDDRRELVIDPQRIWGTYYGGTGIETGAACATDANGNIYMAGTAYSSSGIASGGHQNALSGTTDAYLVKFNASGTRLWATYYGGANSESGESCAVDHAGNVHLAGTTSSTSGVASGGHQNTNSGTAAFLVKFSPSGTRIWGTYYGGSATDEGKGCAVDGSGNVYLTGLGGSSTGIASGGHQNVLGGGKDAFLVKFSASGARLWGTYYGGVDNDQGMACAADNTGNVYLTGWTESSNAIASAGHQSSLGGDRDAFLVKFTSSGTRVWGTYYGGSGLDAGTGCTADGSGHVLLSGSTSSTTGIASGGHQNAYGGGTSDAFLVKLNSDGVRQWATYYGGSGGESDAASCAIDAENNVYLAGVTGSGSGIASGGHQNAIGGSGDGFLAAFNSSGVRQWGSYYGGDLNDAARACAVDANGNPCIAGTTLGSTMGIADSGHQNSFAGEWDAFLAKFQGLLTPTISTGSINGPFCAGQAVSIPFTITNQFDPGNTFTAQLSNASGSFASPVSIGTLSGTLSGTINGSIPGGTAQGSGYRIRVIGSSPAIDGSDNGSNLTINDPNTNCICAETSESEPNNSTGQATPLPNDTKVGGQMGACVSADNSSDYFSFTTAAQGVLTVQYCMSNTGPDPLQVTCRLLNSTGTELASSSHTAGANNVTSSSPFFHICLGAGSYRIAIDNPSTDYCTHYTLAYSIEEPVFGNDPEPNDAIGASATPVAYDTYREGRIGFLGQTPYDYFSITPPTNGVMNIEVQAEHVQETGDPLVVDLINHLGALVQSWDVHPGDFSAVSTTNLSIPCRSTVDPYYIRMSSQECGISYQWKYTMSPPLFAADAEPNNNVPGTAVAHDAYANGQVQFDGESTYDYFNIVPPASGVMSIEVQAEHVAGSAGTMELAICNAAGTAIQTWTVDVGANSTATTTTVSIPCRSGTTNYNVRFASTTCGVSYRWKYVMAAPLFSNDVEPNNAVNGDVEDYDTWYEGQVGFDNQTDDDIFTIDPPNSGIMHIAVEAEHTGASPGTVTVALLSAAGTVLQSWDMVAGANGVMEDSLVSVTCRSGAVNYNLRFSDVTCGVSYRWKYTMTAPHFANDVEPNNSVPGNSLAHDTFTEGQVQFDGDTYDYYTITPPTNGVMHFEVEAEHVGTSTAAMELALLNSAGTVIQTWPLSVGANGVPQASAMSITCRSTVNPYRVRITSSNCGVSYRFKYAMAAPLFAVDAEPNNTQPGTALAANTYTEGHLNFDAENVYDIYRIVPAVNGMVNVELQAEHTGATHGTMTVVLLSTGGTTLQTWSFPIGANSVPLTATLSKTCLTGGTAYDLRLSSSVCGASYRLKYTLTTPAFLDDAEPNNTNATALVLPDSVTAEGHLNFDGDNSDGYRLNPGAQGVLNLLIEAEHAGTATNATITANLYSSGGSFLQSWTVPIGAASVPIGTVVTRNCVGFTDYYLYLSSTICLTSYRISYVVPPTAFANDAEPDNSMASAIPAVQGLNHDGHLSFDNDDNEDFYRIQPTGNGTLNLTLSLEAAAAGNVRVDIYHGDGWQTNWYTQPVGIGGVPLSSTQSYACYGQGDYFVRVRGEGPCGISYRLSYTVTPPLFANDVEPNNSFVQAGANPALPQGTAAQGQVNFVHYGDNNDIHRIVTSVNGVLNITLGSVANTAGNARVDVYNSAGAQTDWYLTPVGTGGVAATATQSLNCYGAGTYYVQVRSNGPCGISYQLSYTVSEPLFVNDIEPNNTITEAGANPVLAPGATTEGQVGFNHYGDNDDYYHIPTPGDGTLNLTLHSIAATAGNMRVDIFNSAGGQTNWFLTPVGTGGSAASTTLSFDCYGQGDYYVRVRSDGPCGIGYQMSYTLTAPVFANDTEPNGTTQNAVVLDPDASEADGHLNFLHYGENIDYYKVVLPAPGSIVLTLQAEAAIAGAIRLDLYNSNGVQITWATYPIGGSHVPASSTINYVGLAADTYYVIIQSVDRCGVSYRFKCNDTDADGTCNAFDLCTGGPEPGTPCDDGNAATINDVITSGCLCAGTAPTVSVPLRVLLEGPYDAVTGLMNDALRALATFPLTDPYPALGYMHTGGGGGSVAPAVLAVGGADAITDWILVELRDANDAGTVVASRSALLQRDGDVVDLDGTTVLTFTVEADEYHIAVLHRNHLGCMTSAPVTISATSSLVDFTTSTTITYGTEARRSVTGTVPAEVLWSGDVNFDGVLKYTGTANDRDPILIAIGGSVPTNTTNGYTGEDVNMDGTVKYTGTSNDRDPILINIGAAVPTNSRPAQLP